MSWGDYQLDLLSFKPSKVAYDVAVDIIDNLDGDCHLTLIVRDDLYDQADAKQIAESYVCLTNAFAAQPTTTLSEALMFDNAEIEGALNLGRGESGLQLGRRNRCVGSQLICLPNRSSVPVAKLGRYSPS